MPERADPLDELLDQGSNDQGLRQRTQRNVGISLLSQGILTAIRVVSVGVLARFLQPSEFGLIGMATVVTGFLDMFRDAGLALVTVQRKDLTRRDLNSLFWINCALGLTVSLLVACSGPFLNWFYHEPRLNAIAAALAVITIIGSLGIQHRALMRRNLAFGQLAVIDVSAAVIAAGVGILLARAGYSYWAILIMYATTSAVTTGMAFFFSGWMPGRPALTKKSREYVKFGANITGANLFGALAARVDNLLVARYWGAGALGLYDRAYQLMMAPLKQFDGAIGSAIFPALCKIQEDSSRLRAAILKVQSVTFALTVPATTTLIVFADVVVRVLLGEKWMEIVPIFSTLAAVTVFMSICRPVGWILRARGLGSTILRFEIIGSCLAIVAFIIGVNWGPLGVARALLIENALWSVVLLTKLSQLIELKSRHVFSLMILPVIVGGVCVGAGLLLRHFTGELASPTARVVLMCAFGATGTGLAVLVQPAVRQTVRESITSFFGRRRAPAKK